MRLRVVYSYWSLLKVSKLKEILNVTVGSLAHGTDHADSDVDTRAIYVLPTSEIVGIGNYQKFIENKVTDENSWELAHYIYLGLRSNPTILEAILSPIVNLTSEEGEELRTLFPCFLNRKHVYNAFKGFATGQRKKMLSPQTNACRKPKSASHYLRVLYNGIELLNSGTFTVKIMETEIGRHVLAAKRSELLFEEVLQIGDELLEKIDIAYANSILPIEADKETINKFLLKIRKENW